MPGSSDGGAAGSGICLTQTTTFMALIQAETGTLHAISGSASGSLRSDDLEGQRHVIGDHGVDADATMRSRSWRAFTVQVFTSSPASCAAATDVRVDA